MSTQLQCAIRSKYVRNYPSRLDRIEFAIAPEECFRVAILPDGQAQDDAYATYAMKHGLTPAEARRTVLYLSDDDARLL